MSPHPTCQRLVQVSAGLALDGGGTAVVARLIAEVAADFARSAGLPFRILSLQGVGTGPPSIETRHYNGRRAALGMAVWRQQVTTRGTCLIFDHPGPARMQALIPGPLRDPYAVFLYGIDVWRSKCWLQERSLGAATRLLTISEFTRRRAREAFPELDRLEVVYPALEERKPTGAADEQLLAATGKGYLLIVGRMSASERYKGHDQLLTAMSEIVSQWPEARLVVAGDGDDRPRLEARANALGLGGHVVFTGFVSEATLDELYRRCVAFVMPSTEEGFGLVYLEAMKAGKPCIAARGSAAEEIVVQEETGLLVDADDSAEIASCCLQLLSRPGEAADLGRQGFLRWRQTFSRESFHHGLVPILEELTGRSDVRD